MTRQSRQAMPSPKVVTINRLPPPGRITEVVDEMGRLSARLREIKPLQDRYEQLRKQVVWWYENEPADQQYTHEGAACVVEVSARGEQRTIKNLRAVQKLMGAAFWTVATVPLAEIDKRVSPAEQDAILARAATGPRRVTVTTKLEEQRAS